MSEINPFPDKPGVLTGRSFRRWCNQLKAHLTSTRVLADEEHGWNQTLDGLIPPCDRVGGEETPTCSALRVTLRDGGACISRGYLTVVNPSLNPDGIEVTIAGAPFGTDSEICIPYDPNSECLVLCIESRGGDPKATPPVPDGIVVAMDIQTAPLGSKPDDIPCEEAQYDDDDVQTDPEVNGVVYRPFYDPLMVDDPQVWCGSHQLNNCGGCTWVMAPYGGL